MSDQVKTCSKCREEKITGEFYVSKKAKDGLQSYCNLCQRGAASMRQKRMTENKGLIYRPKDNRSSDPNYQKEIAKKRRENMSSDYIARMIYQNTSLKNDEIPKELIELKRMQLQLTREIRKQKQCQKQPA